MHKILFVFDTRDDSLNWGGRASSLALGQLLERFGTLTSVGSRWATRPVPTGPIAGRIRQRRHGDQVLVSALSRRAVQQASAAIGMDRDFVALDPRESVQRFLTACRHDPSLAWLKRSVGDADTVVVNAQGALIFQDPPRRDLNFLMFILELARQLGKPAYFINALASDSPLSGTNLEVEEAVARTLNTASGVLTREPVSTQRLHQLGVAQAKTVPDAVYLWAQEYPELLSGEFRLERPEFFDVWPEYRESFRGERVPRDYVALLGASRHPHEDIGRWPDFFERTATAITDRLRLPVVFVDSGGDGYLEAVARQTGSRFIRPQLNVLLGTHLLANARGMVGGRFHPGILGSLGGTPGTFLECASHKTLSLQPQLGYPEARVFPINPTPDNVDAVVSDLAHNLEEGRDLRERLSETVELLAEQARSGFEAVMRSVIERAPSSSEQGSVIDLLDLNHGPDAQRGAT